MVVEAITFQEFVEYGKAHSSCVIDGVPQCFDYCGKPITHERDDCFLIPSLEGMMNFTPEDMLITGVDGEIYPCKIEIFDKTYEAVPEKSASKRLEI